MYSLIHWHQCKSVLRAAPYGCAGCTPQKGLIGGKCSLPPSSQGMGLIHTRCYVEGPRPFVGLYSTAQEKSNTDAGSGILRFEHWPCQTEALRACVNYLSPICCGSPTYRVWVIIVPISRNNCDISMRLCIWSTCEGPPCSKTSINWLTLLLAALGSGGEENREVGLLPKNPGANRWWCLDVFGSSAALDAKVFFH